MSAHSSQHLGQTSDHAQVDGTQQILAAEPEPVFFSALKPRRGSSFVKRMHWPRIIGMGLAFFMIGAAIQQAGAPLWAWAVLFLNGFAWPHLAYLWAMRSGDPFRAEHRNQLIDSASGGFWVVAIDFNLIPAVLMLTMLSMNHVSIGGVGALLRSLIVMAIGALVALPLFGFNPQLTPSLHVIIASIPFMVTYPVAVGVISYRLAQQLSQQKRRFEALSQRDALSGLATRGYWETRLAEEFSRSRRQKRPATLMLIDIDNFKHINDTHGHLLGDTVIRLIGEMLDTQTRAGDFVGRFGGDEFALILPETSGSNAIKVAQRIQRALSAVTIPEQPDFSMTASVGVAQLSRNVSSPRDWVSSADNALYQAKRSGRNCIRVFEDDRADEPFG